MASRKKMPVAGLPGFSNFFFFKSLTQTKTHNPWSAYLFQVRDPVKPLVDMTGMSAMLAFVFPLYRLPLNIF